MSGGAPGPDPRFEPSANHDALLHDALVLSGPATPDRGHPDAPPFIVRLAGVRPADLRPLAALVADLGGRLHDRGQGHVGIEVPAAAATTLAQHRQRADPGSPSSALAAVIAAFGRERFELQCGAHQLQLGPRPLIMGIINCTPDSFWSGSTASGEEAIARGQEMIQAGADLLDVGGESTRPASAPVSAEVEIERVCPVVRALSALPVPVSIDTTKAAVAQAAVDAGATMINDISGLAYDPDLAAVAARHRLPLVVMHMRGRPQAMYEHAEYGDALVEVARELRHAERRARLAGVEQVIIDPGIGFAKRPETSLTLLHRLAVLRSLGCPILVGPSRKSFLGAVLDLPVQERLEGTAAAVAAAVLAGAHILRVHDVQAMRRVALVAAAIRDEGVACSL